MVVLSGFWRAMLDPFGGQMQGSRGQVWPSWALSKYLEATALLLGARLVDLEGKLSDRELSWAMLCHVEAICQILFGHVLGFASRNAFPQQDQDFTWVSASYVGSIWGSSTAILWPRWCHLGANFGDVGAELKAMGSFWTILLRHIQKQPADTPPKRPLALKARQNQIKNCPKTQKR